MSEIVPRVVEAAMVVSAHGGLGKTDLNRAIEAAMSRAVLDASTDGVTDPAEIKARMLAAREHAKAAQ